MDLASLGLIGGAAPTPPTSNRRVQRGYDRNLYADRNKVERLFGRLKHSRRVATRDEKLGRNSLAMADVAPTMTLL